ncbi:MAG: M23 family metallopeptidase [Sphaerochaetaceae bacterium]|jgi:lipoprotein NlpD|nr:M23 family metallopeptidase [Sphaerochaetaceae bacterium]
MANDYDDLQGPRKLSANLRMILIVAILSLALLVCAAVLIYVLTRPEAPVEAVTPEPAIANPVEPEAPASPVAQAAQPQESQDKAVGLDSIKPASSGSSVQYQKYIVTGDDTLAKISQAFGISERTIISVNKITNPSALKQGDTLQIPDRDGFLYTVQSGDTLSFITTQFDLSIGYIALQEINGLETDKLMAGQSLFIPDETSASSISMTAGGLRFSSPMDGRTIVYFGQKVPDPFTRRITSLEGIYIQGIADEPVKAAARGVVVSADMNTDLGAYVVKISHDGLYTTSYINLATCTVKADDTVEAKTVIGTVGKAIAYSSADSVLYFKVEQSNIALDPTSVF